MMTDPIRQRYELMAGHLNKYQWRLWAGAEAQVLGWGGISQVSRATGLSRGVVAAGRRELSQPDRGAALGARVCSVRGPETQGPDPPHPPGAWRCAGVGGPTGCVITACCR
jgi:hypothetical protein